MFTINIILIGNVKVVYESTGSSIYDSRKTDKYVTDVQTGTEYWVDAIARIFKQDVETDVQQEDGTIVRRTITKRKLAVMDCRFEDKELDNLKHVFEAPTFTEVIEHLMKVYPK
jgi:hypothetical protein